MPAAKKTAPKPAAKKATVKKIAPKPAKAAAVEREVQNDVTRPGPNTKTGRVWEIFDKLSTDAPAARSAVMEAAKKEGIPEATVATQYQRLRTFYGITERSARTAAPVEKVGKAKKAAAKAAKAPAKKAAAKKAAPKPPAKKRAPKAPPAEAAAE